MSQKHERESSSEHNTRDTEGSKQETQSEPTSIPPPSDSHVHKKKRVTRLCDECRRKKVKCDGQQPCIHCTVYSYECSYNQPSAKRRTGQDPVASNVNKSMPHLHHHALDDGEDANAKKLQLYETFIEQLLPDLKNVNIYKLNGCLAQLKNEASGDASNNADINVSDLTSLYQSATRNGIPFSLTSPPGTTSSSTPQQALAIDGSFESYLGKEIKIILPPKDILVKLISSTWDNTCVLFRFYHRPSFIKQLSILYETDPLNYTDTQQKFLPLVYSVMACGSLFYKSAEITRNSIGQTKDEQDIFDDEGYKYFILLRKLIDITDTRDIYGIQTIVMLVLFLQCGARLSTCYSYVGIGLRALLREGFHRRLKVPFDPIQLEVRKRIFWTMYKMDIYVNAMLGLPMSLNDEDFDQDLPIELDDENITEFGYNFKNQKALSSSAILNSHTKLLLIMKKVVQQLYPVNKLASLSLSLQRYPNINNTSSNNIVYNLELELQKWVNDLPLELKPGIEPNERYFKANRLLHFSYLHIKIILYRPFIHYISRDFQNSTNIDDLKLLEKLKNCINVARIVVKLSEDMISKNMLSGSYWFSVYTIFFSVACLVYYVHFGPGILDDEYMLIKLDLELGKKVLEILKNSTTLARRTFDILNSVFEQMNLKTALNTKEQTTPAPAASASVQLQPSVREQNVDINDIVNGVNYIDGKGTGIKLNMSIPTPLNGQNLGSAPVNVQQVQQESQRIQQLQQMLLLQQQMLQPLLPLPLLQSSYNTTTTTNTNSNGQTPPIIDPVESLELDNDKYLPGIMDKFDERIFGKLLPPFMNSDFNNSSLELISDLLNKNNANATGDPMMEFPTKEEITDADDAAKGQPIDSNDYNFDELLNEWAHDSSTYK